jgi:beta-N-acetylhexosaminidase
VLDRPNPHRRRDVEGALLDPTFRVVRRDVPDPGAARDDVGELALLFNQKYEIGADLVVARVENWRRSQWQDQTGLPVGEPVAQPALAGRGDQLPGTVYFEGTTLTEGRGTDRPYEQIAPRGSTPPPSRRP